MRKLLPVVSLLWALSCSSPPAPCTSSAQCTGINKCINGTCQDPTGCVPETSPAYCARLAKSCGTVSGEDNCGATRLEACGTCQAPQSCVDNTCQQCVAETDAALCARIGLDCNSASATDNCGALRTVDCGMCDSSKTCGGGGTPNVCGGCVPETEAEFCASQGKNCGAFTGTDRCGNARTAVCGTCAMGQPCGGGGTPNVCGCTPENDGAFCLRVGKNCGSVTAADNCGAMRTASCGMCSGGATCGTSGSTANICSGCVPETTQEFCGRQGKNCGPVTANDNCGTQRSVMCGTCMGPGATCGGA
ncbi:MAG: hypothetical protein JNK82_31565, partial [Myxococcaceae bacterium]|nr:hypothetical protein [Myxococcaceae bacterium]